jgi:hypothetical protein
MKAVGRTEEENEDMTRDTHEEASTVGNVEHVHM